MLNNRNRRLRKKLYLDEFAVFGFSLSCDVNLNDEEEVFTLIDSLTDLLGGRNLCLGGGGGVKSLNVFICSLDRYGSVSNEDRQSVIDWADSNGSVSNFVAGELVDANYGSFK